ncbi:MAG: hypothetical protein PHP42_02720 [Bacteroidota bacterium]|nr:hypothetical protein [Bacteroidota bacterium]
MKTVVTFIAVGFILSTVSAFAQSAATPGIDKREHHQQKRIIQGMKSGELTPGETAKLEAKEAKIKHDEKTAKADGKVTPQERKKLNREENRASHAIYHKKHNAQHQ